MKVNKKIEKIIIELKIISFLDMKKIKLIKKNQSGWKPLVMDTLSKVIVPKFTKFLAVVR